MEFRCGPVYCRSIYIFLSSNPSPRAQNPLDKRIIIITIIKCQVRHALMHHTRGYYYFLNILIKKMIYFFYWQTCTHCPRKLYSPKTRRFISDWLSIINANIYKIIAAVVSRSFVKGKKWRAKAVRNLMMANIIRARHTHTGVCEDIRRRFCGR